MSDFLYIFFILGLVMWQYPVISSYFNVIKCRIILRQNLKRVSDEEDNREYKGLYRELDKLLIATSYKNRVKCPEDLMHICLVLGCGMGLSVYFVGGIYLALLAGISVGFLPIILLYVKLKKQRTSSSKEGDLMVQEILANYKVYDYNMKEALEESAANLEGAPTSKTILLELIRGLNKAYSKEEIQNVLDTFKYSLGTAWGNALASDIYFAQVHGIKVTESLEDLCETITKSRRIIEHSKQEHNEARLMLKYLAPISYVLSIVCACKFFGFSLGRFILYQFMTPLGLQWFIIVIMCYVVGIVVNSWLTNEKMDIV